MSRGGGRDEGWGKNEDHADHLIPFPRKAGNRYVGRGVGWEGDGHEGGFHTLVGNSQTAPDTPVFLRGKLIPVLMGDPGSKRGELSGDLSYPARPQRGQSGSPGAPHTPRPTGQFQTGFSGSASLPGTRWGIR